MKVYIAIVQEPMQSLDCTRTAAFFSYTSAQKWVDEIIIGEYGEDPHGDCRMNWDIHELTVQP